MADAKAAEGPAGVSAPQLRVAADLGSLLPGSSGGIVNVVAETLRELAGKHPEIELVAYCSDHSRSVMEGELPNLSFVTFASDGFYGELERQLATRPADVLFRSYPTLEQLSFPLERQIVLMPDLLHELRPELFPPEILESRYEAFRLPLLAAGAVATISSYARSTIRQVPGRTPDVFVMYPSVPTAFVASRSDDATAEERSLVPTGDFFFYPGNLWPHKNHERLLEAVARFRKSTGCKTELVLTGALDGCEDLLRRYSEDGVRHLGYVRAPMLRLLYERATALTYFSLHEGFGIPVLEAFQAGTPVLCSNVSSLPEVAGDAALTCDPEDVEAMADAMKEISSNQSFRELLIHRGKERLPFFSWSKTADQLGAAIARVHRRAITNEES